MDFLRVYEGVKPLFIAGQRTLWTSPSVRFGILRMKDARGYVIT